MNSKPRKILLISLGIFFIILGVIGNIANNWQDFWLGLIFIGIGIYLIVSSSKLPKVSNDKNIKNTKKCKYCKSKIEKDAKICPYCKKNQKMPTLVIVALIISIVAVCKKVEEKSGKGMSIAGLILSSVSIIISVFIVIGLFIIGNFAFDSAKGIINEFKNSDLGEYIGAEVKLIEKYEEIEFKNEDKMYTGYIDRKNGEYVDRFKGIEIEDYYEEYMESKGYDVDIYVNAKGEPVIENDF